MKIILFLCVLTTVMGAPVKDEVKKDMKLSKALAANISELKKLPRLGMTQNQLSLLWGARSMSLSVTETDVFGPKKIYTFFGSECGKIRH